MWQTDSFDLLYSDNDSRIQVFSVGGGGWAWLWNSVSSMLYFCLFRWIVSLSMYCFTFMYTVSIDELWWLVWRIMHTVLFSVWNMTPARLRWCLGLSRLIVCPGSRLRLRQQFRSRWLASSQFCESRDAQVCLETEFVVLSCNKAALVVHGFAWMLPKHHCKLCFLFVIFIFFGIQCYIIHMN